MRSIIQPYLLSEYLHTKFYDFFFVKCGERKINQRRSSFSDVVEFGDALVLFPLTSEWRLSLGTYPSHGEVSIFY